LFYASTEFNPRNTIWRDLPAMTSYIARVQSILQGGQPDNDVLVYWPIYDLWNDASGMEKRFAMSPSKWANDSAGGKTAKELIDHGYALDFASDAQLLETEFKDGWGWKTPGSTYRVLLVPPCDRMPVETLHQILKVVEAGATAIFQSHLPSDVPGMGDLESRRAKFKADLARIELKDDGAAGQLAIVGKGRVRVSESSLAPLTTEHVRREPIADSGVGFVRRLNDGGARYFFANLSGQSLDGWVGLGHPSAAGVLLDPLTGRSGVAAVRQTNGTTEVRLQLRPGESMVLRCFDDGPANGRAWTYLEPDGEPVNVAGQWHVDFIDGGPAMPASFTTDKLASWTTLGDDEAKRFAGTARYRIEFDLPASTTPAEDWRLDLGDVRESARVRVNGQEAGTIWSLPFTLDIAGSLLKPGERNTLELEVTNLAANRVRDLDRRGVKWKAFHEINYVDIHYKPFDASKWELVDSGLLGPVTLTPMKRQETPK
jgi:hypothetical protein